MAEPSIASNTDSYQVARHPDYTYRLPDWQTMIDCYEGERAIKEAGEDYLPPTAGMRAKGWSVASANPQSDAYMAYDAYRTRAQFPPYVSEAVTGLVGIMHRKPPTIEVPKAIEELKEKLTILGEPGHVLLRKINEAQLTTGRIGLLVDPVDGAPANVPPRVAVYEAKAILNWITDKDPATGTLRYTFLALDESGYTQGVDYCWAWTQKTRYLRLRDGVYETALVIGQRPPSDGGDGDASDWTAPTVGGRTISRIPFVVVNVTDVGVACPASPPLLGLGYKSIALYRKSADYEQHLHECGQATLVAIGGKVTDSSGGVFLGANGIIEDFPLGGDVKYLEIAGTGLSAQREAIDDDRTEAEARSAHLVDTKGAGIEAAETVRIRVAARMTSIINVGNAAAEGLAEVYRICAEWKGANPDEVSIVQNTDFDAAQAPVAELGQIIAAKQAGAPLPWADIHAWLVKNEFIPSERTLEETMAMLAQEAMDMPGTGAAEGDLDPMGGEDEGEGEDEDGEDEDGGDDEEPEDDEPSPPPPRRGRRRRVIA